MAENVLVRRLDPAPAMLVASATRPAGVGVEIEPGQWLIDGDARPLDATLVLDMREAYVGFAVTGDEADALLAQGMALDFARLAPDFAGRAKLGEIAVLIDRWPGGWRVRCERSYAEWLAGWLARAAALMSSTGGI